MKKHFWKIEYSITIFVIFAIVLLFIPTRFISSKEASFVSRWNDSYNKMNYIFSAMNAQADSDIIKGLKKATTNHEREKYMMLLVKPYLRISDQNKLKKKYDYFYMNGRKVQKGDEYYFDNLYMTSNNKIVGIKDIKDEDIFHPAFIMMFDINGYKGPNAWGKDIFGINIFVDSSITPLGKGYDTEKLKHDCSMQGSGVYCSHYYRIGGEFSER